MISIQKNNYNAVKQIDMKYKQQVQIIGQFEMIEQIEEEMNKAHRYYLRFHMTIEKAIQLNKQIYGDKKTKDNRQYRFEHAIRVAGMTEEINDQTIGSYHLTWLLGILHDAQEDNPLLYSEKIDQVLQDLLPKQIEKIKKYVSDLSSDRSLSKGDQKRQQVERMRKLDIIPTWIKLFDKYDNCKRFKQNSCGKTQKQLKGYYAVAYLCYYLALQTYGQKIKDNISEEINSFYEKMAQQLGTLNNIKKLAQEYFKL